MTLLFDPTHGETMNLKDPETLITIAIVGLKAAKKILDMLD